jgi:hypothetical protein
MSWFNRHPNWTIFFSWLFATIFYNLTALLPISENSNLWYLILAIVILIVWGTLAWSLTVKKRSLFNLFYIFLPVFGLFIVWSMRSSEAKEVMREDRGSTIERMERIARSK